eukprot:3208021-Rhodomonas_salina.2
MVPTGLDTAICIGVCGTEHGYICVGDGTYRVMVPTGLDTPGLEFLDMLHIDPPVSKVPHTLLPRSFPFRSLGAVFHVRFNPDVRLNADLVPGVGECDEEDLFAHRALQHRLRLWPPRGLPHTTKPTNPRPETHKLQTGNTKRLKPTRNPKAYDLKPPKPRPWTLVPTPDTLKLQP